MFSAHLVTYLVVFERVIQKPAVLAAIMLQKAKAVFVLFKIYIHAYFIQVIVLLHLQTPFVRQNTPHPKELKAKAHKLFGKGKAADVKAADGKAAAEKSVSELCEEVMGHSTD
jgi:hypothetical protein